MRHERAAVVKGKAGKEQELSVLGAAPGLLEQELVIA